jgi:hypothetical protein
MFSGGCAASLMSFWHTQASVSAYQRFGLHGAVCSPNGTFLALFLERFGSFLVDFRAKLSLWRPSWRQNGHEGDQESPCRGQTGPRWAKRPSKGGFLGPKV